MAIFERDIGEEYREQTLSLATQRAFADAWKELLPTFPQRNMHIFGTSEDALQLIRTLYDFTEGVQADILVTGSVRLSGGFIEAARLESLAFA
jgi:folylpolyglutamate synthase